MSVYKIFPSKDSTIYSQYPTLNTGIDEILELSSNIDGISRALIQFSDNDIFNTLGNLTSSFTYNVYLKLFLANAENLSTNYSIDACLPLQDWDMGTGRYDNNPIVINGVSWNSASLSNAWTIPGGHFSDYNYTQSFEYNDNKDLEIDVTGLYNIWTSHAGGNNGILLKLDDNSENNESGINLKFFSIDTHTIYPPCLELRWNDSVYITGSLNQPSTSNIVLSLGNNKNEYQQDSIQRFRINCRDKYPPRTFTTSSVYLINNALPENSCWALKDLDTKETIIDFDGNYTQLSCDGTSSYFDIYMNGLQPERYYQILIKTEINNTTTIFDDLTYFKVVQ